MRISCLFFLWLICFTVYGQVGYIGSTTAKSESMGGADLTLKGIYSLFGNPGGLADLERLQFLGNSSNHFLTDINRIGFGVATPSLSGVFGLQAGQFGMKEYKEQFIGLSYGRKLFDKLNIGLKFNFLNTSILEYENQTSFHFGLGIQSKLNREIIIGAFLYSPANLDFQDDFENQTLFKIGGSWSPSKKLMIAAELEKDLTFPVRFNAGLEYAFAEKLESRIGIRTEPVIFSFGLGINFLNNFNFDTALSYHQILGFSPSFSIIFQKKK